MRLAFKYDGGEEERIQLLAGFKNAGFNVYAVGQASNDTTYVIVEVSSEDVLRFIHNIEAISKGMLEDNAGALQLRTAGFASGSEPVALPPKVNHNLGEPIDARLSSLIFKEALVLAKRIAKGEFMGMDPFYIASAISAHLDHGSSI